MNKGLVAWGIILVMILLSLLPFLLLDKSGVRSEQLGPFIALGVLPIVFAAWLRARTGALVTCLLLVSGLCLFSLHANGPVWMIQVDGTSLISTTLGFLILALATGQLRCMGKQLTESHERLERAYATIQMQALTDGLTNLPNHRAVMDQFTKEIDRARRYLLPFSILFFDVDHFKRVNDTYGHGAGDAVLCQIGERARRCLRSGDTIGRFGGEEFVILLFEAEASGAGIVAERIRAAIAAEPMALSEVVGGIAMTVSIGRATYVEDGQSEQELLAQADQAMYVAKRMGRNQVRSATEARQISADSAQSGWWDEQTRIESLQREGWTPEQIQLTGVPSQVK